MSQWLDFACLKRAVRLEWVLAHYGITALRRSRRDQYRGRCPIHGGEGRDAFHVNLAKQVFHCFSCGAGGSVLDLVAALEGCGLREAALRLASWHGMPLGLGQAAPKSKQLVTEKIEVPPLPPLGFRLRGVHPEHPYLRARGMEMETLSVFGVGFYAGPGLLSGRVVIPIPNEHGELVAYCGRSLDGGTPRYRFPTGFRKSSVLFNLHRAAAIGDRRVVVVEGFFDCMKVHQAGIASVVALMGTWLSPQQEDLLCRYFQEIILMLDGDQAGLRASRAMATRLAGAVAVRLITLDDGLQPDQLTSACIRELCQGPGAN